ncbi:sugar ABC transporter permease [Leifsonia sp. NPDC058292]|uniref:sugar ABC transporter permease n=1 Tax=Leifsonia sp. NPDC058292 TaxID=3346428 RepID=UPI0036D7B25D
MSRTRTPTAPTPVTDSRIARTGGIGDALTSFGHRVRGGDLGSLPVVVGLVLIWAVFQLLNPTFLSPQNLVNLAVQCAAVGTIAIGIVLVLLIGQIDLSVGSVSGLSGVIVGVTFVNFGWPLPVSIVAAILTGSVLGLIYGLLFTSFGVPSFLITLAALLTVLGLQFWVLGKNSTINIPYDSPLVFFTQQLFLPPWLAYTFAGLAAIGMFFSDWRTTVRRRNAGLPEGSLTWMALKAALLLVALCLVIWYLAKDRGVGAMFLLFVVLVALMNFLLRRTRWGRSVYAVGGSVEAARRAGIRVNRVYISVFVLCSSFAALGGVLAAGRLASVSLSSGGTDTSLNAIAAAVIGGTSLFGGRGRAWSALVGILVIQSISNGLILLNLDSSYRYMITGVVTLLAVVIDSLSRRSRASHGQA